MCVWLWALQTLGRAIQVAIESKRTAQVPPTFTFHCLCVRCLFLDVFAAFSLCFHCIFLYLFAAFVFRLISLCVHCLSLTFQTARELPRCLSLPLYFASFSCVFASLFLDLFAAFSFCPLARHCLTFCFTAFP